MQKVIGMFESLENCFRNCWKVFMLLLEWNHLFVITVYNFACSIRYYASKIQELPYYVYSTAIDSFKETCHFSLEIITGFPVNCEKTINIFFKLAFVHDFSQLSNDFLTLFKFVLKILPVIIVIGMVCIGMVYLMYEIYKYLSIRFEEMRETMNEMMEEQQRRREAQVERPIRRTRQRRQRQANVEPRQPETAQQSQQSEVQHQGEEQASTSSVQRSYLCCVCLVNNCEIVLMPCKHLCICESCFAQSRAISRTRLCPICQQLVKRNIKIFA
jgi:hypothetical protein